MKITKLFLCVPVGWAALTQTITAQNISGFNENFNGYSTDGDLTAAWTRASGTTANIGLVADPDPSGTHGQSIFQTSASNVGQLTKSFATGITPTDANPVIFSFDFYDVNGGTTTGRNYVELRNASGTGGLFDAGLINSVTTGIYNQSGYQARNIDSGAWIQLAATRSVGWHTFEFDIRATTVDLKIDGVIDANFNNLHWNGGAVYNLIKVGSALSSNTTADYDNISVVVVPEPSIVAFSLLAGFGLLWHVVKRQRG